MHLYDTIVSYSKQLKKSSTSIRNFDDQMRDVTEASRKIRLKYEECQKREDELKSKLAQARVAEEEARGNLLRYHELFERYEVKNKVLRVRLVAHGEELEESHRSVKATEE